MNLIRIWNLALNLIFPPVCLACKTNLKTAGEKSNLICEFCARQIEINNGVYCSFCSRRLYDGARPCHPQSKFVLAAVTDYAVEPVRGLIQTLKYGGLKPALDPWRKLINVYLAKISIFNDFDSTDTVVVPIPLYKSRERERGFNQAELIASVISESLQNKSNLGCKVPVATDALQKIRKTLSQTECADHEARTKNIMNAFEIKNAATLCKKNVILVDDVFTSGATMNEAARILKEAGVKKIIGFVLAKA